MLRITLKGLLGHMLRFTLISVIVTTGTALVVGAFVLTESVEAQFGTLFQEINAGIDLQVRGVEKFETQSFGGNVGPPISDDLVPEVAEIDGVQAASPTVGGFADIISKDGEKVGGSQGIGIAFNWTDETILSTVDLVEGRGPQRDDEMAMDIDSAEDAGYQVGDTVRVTTPQGAGEYVLAGTVRFGENNSLLGAHLSAFTTAEAQRLFNLEGKVQTIEVSLEDGADIAEVEAAIAALLPADAEVVQQQTIVDESNEQTSSAISGFLNVLLGFAFVILFVAMFLIYNVFRIVVGQRVRELALLRAVGASTRQVFGSVVGEALAMGIVAGVFGFGLGLLIARALNALINSVGFGTGSNHLVVTPTPLIAAFTVAIVVTVLSAVLPAWQTTRIPPVAALRDGFSLDSGSWTTRLAVGGVATVLGILMVGSALFGNSDGLTLLVGMAAGSVILFLGIAGLSPLFAAPLARALATPFRVFKMTGRLATENSARSPRRTAATASALMIGLALVTLALVAGNSLKTSFSETLGTTIRADWYVDSGAFSGFSPEIAAELRERPEIAAVSSGRFGQMQVEGSTKAFNAVDYETINDVFELGIVSGEVAADAQGLIVGADPAEDLELRVGDLVDVTFNETGTVPLPVLAIIEETGVLGNWVIDMGTYEDNFTERLDYFLAATTAEGVSESAARAAIEAVVTDFPQLEVLDRQEYEDQLNAQVDIILAIVNAFLLMAVFIAGLGIAITLALSVFERTRELGLLRAIGQTQRQVWAMITMEAVVVAVLGAVLGIVLGIGFGVATASAMPDDIISIIDIPWANLVVVLILAALLGVVAAIYPAWRASRLNILDAIAFE